MAMSSRAYKLLLKIGNTDDGATRLTAGNGTAANELCAAGLARFVPISSGGVWVAMTTKGMTEYEKAMGVGEDSESGTESV